MKTFFSISILFVLGISFLFSCSQEKKPVIESISSEVKADSLKAVRKTEKKDFSIGEKVYTDNCVTCHGVDGKRKHNQAKDLSISTLNIDESIKIISSAQTIGCKMKAPRFSSELSENDINEVAQYIVTLRK